MSLFIDEVVEENAKLKKAIEILKEKCSIFIWENECKNGKSYELNTLDRFEYITEEEYNLLKEVFRDE